MAGHARGDHRAAAREMSGSVAEAPDARVSYPATKPGAVADLASSGVLYPPLS